MIEIYLNCFGFHLEDEIRVACLYYVKKEEYDFKLMTYQHKFSFRTKNVVVKRYLCNHLALLMDISSMIKVESVVQR